MKKETRYNRFMAKKNISQQESSYQYIHSIDPILAPYILLLPVERLPQSDKYRPAELFYRLCEDIIGQQLSGKVARVITERFALLFSTHPVQPADVLQIEPDALRGVGMSWAKVKTVRDLAKHSVSGSIPWDHLSELSDEEVRTALLPVWGVGDWTVEMFLIFTLGRPDVFSPKDLGLKKAMQVLYSLNELPSPGEASQRAEIWAPYRSVASLALWLSLDTPIRRTESLELG